MWAMIACLFCVRRPEKESVDIIHRILKSEVFYEYSCYHTCKIRVEGHTA